MKNVSNFNLDPEKPDHVRKAQNAGGKEAESRKGLDEIEGIEKIKTIDEIEPESRFEFQVFDQSGFWNNQKNGKQVTTTALSSSLQNKTRRMRKEDRVHGSSQVPYCFYRNQIPEDYPGIPIHWHDEFELMRVNSGTGSLYLEGEILPVSKGAVCLVLPDQLHGIEGHMNYDTLVFSSSMLISTLQERSFEQIVSFLVYSDCLIDQPAYPAKGSLLEKAMNQIFESMDQNSPLWDLYLRSGLLEMVASLEEQGKLKKGRQAPALLELYEPVLRYIQSHLDEKISINDLARTMNLSESRFQHCFLEIFHCSPMEYVLRLRIERACQLLRKTKKPIAQIALDCGFANLSHFNRQFLKRTTMTPRQYRTVQAHPDKSRI